MVCFNIFKRKLKLSYSISEYATRISFRPQVSPADVIESSSPTTPSRVSIKQQRQQSPYTSEQQQQSQQTCYYSSPPPPPPPPPPTSSFSSSSPHHLHLTSTSTPNSSPSSPNSPLPTNRPSVIMTKGMHHHSHQQHYHPYRHYECNTFVQQQYPLPTATNEQWYYQQTHAGGDNLPIHHHPHYHSS